MKLKLPAEVLLIIKTLIENGYTCELVGGAVRDILLGTPTSDWDFATNATPQQVLPLFHESFNENVFGTVMVARSHICQQFGLSDAENPSAIYDITTYRSDGTYENYRHPSSVTWGTTLKEDLLRRDFTINALAIKTPLPTKENIISGLIDGELIDLFNGEDDLHQRLIRTVGDPDLRLREDALRLLRAVRFCVQLSLTIEPLTFEAMKRHANLLEHVSSERISEEFLKILSSADPKRGIELLDETGMLPFILPELLAMKGVRQSGHHIYDVWEHSLRAVAACPVTDPVVRLATLIHDIGKPMTAKELPNGSISFYSHEVVGARIAKQIAFRLKLSKAEAERVFTLVRWHMFTYDKQVTDAYIRRFIRRVGVDNLEAMMALRTGDRIGSGSKASSWRLEELKQRVFEQLHQPLQISDMVIDGHDVMKILEIQPGPKVGTVLSTLFEDVLENPEHNEREFLLKEVEKYK